MGGDRIWSIVDHTDRNTAVLFGDGTGSAVILPAIDNRGILATAREPLDPRATTGEAGLGEPQVLFALGLVLGLYGARARAVVWSL